MIPLQTTRPASHRPFLLHYAFNEDARRFSVDSVSVGAQSSHSGGNAISQRECAGFNWPPPGIPAEEPVSICPLAVNRAGWSVRVNATA
jgi:hypothetical protein